MRPPVGCIVVGSHGASLLGADGWYHEKFFDVFLPRVLAAERLGDLHILIPSPMSAIEGFRALPPRCHVVTCNDDAIGNALAGIPLTDEDAVVFVHPCHLLVSPQEIDRLIGFFEAGSGGYAANNRPVPGNNYPTGIGAEIVSAAQLHRLLADGVLPCGEERGTWIPETEPHHGPRALPQCAGPEITLTCSTTEGRTRLRALITVMEQSGAGPLWDAPAILRAYRTRNQVRTAILLEDEADVGRALQWAEGAGGDCTVISLHPCCSWQLERRRVPHRTMIDYYDAERFHAIGRDNFGRVSRLCASIDSRMPHAVSSWNAPATTGSYALKILFDVTLLKAHVIHNIIAAEHPDAIAIFATQPKGRRSRPLPYSYEDPVYGMIATLPGWKVPVMDLSSHDAIPGDSAEAVRPRDLVAGAKQLLRKRSALLFNAGVILKNHGIRSLLRAGVAAFRGTYTILIYESGYNWDDALPALYSAGMRTIVRVFEPALGSGSAAGTPDPAIITACAQALPHAGIDAVSPVDLTSMLLPGMVEIIGYVEQEAPAAYAQVRALIGEKHVDCLLLATRSSPKGNAVVCAARDSGIPVISWQHGAAGLMDHPIMVQVELRGSTTHLVFGEGVAANYRMMLEACSVPDPPAVVPVGSSSLDRVARTVSRMHPRPARKTVLFVTTSYLLNVWYISFARGEFDENLWQVQRDLLKVFARYPAHDYVVKLHPSHHDRRPLQDFVDDLHAPNICLVVQEEPIEDLLRRADLIIVDLVSTSTLQACTTGTPLIAYTGLYCYDPAAVDLLAHRAAVYPTRQEFVEGVERALRSDDSPHADGTNREFLSRFGTFRNDGRAAERAAALVRDTLTPKKNTP